LASRITSRRYWIVAHGIEAWCELPFLKRVAFAKADRLLVTSKFSRDQVMQRHMIGSKPTSSLPCTLDESLLSIRPAKYERLPGLSRAQQVLLTVARLDAAERYKGHDVVIRALPSIVERVPNLTYVIAGDGDDRGRLEDLARELGVTDHVVFAGQISDAELVTLYERSDIFVLPATTVIDSHQPKGEGFGIVYLEAMAFGKPVIGPNYGAPAELIKDGQNGLQVDPADVPAVAEALLKLLTNPELACIMGKAASKWARTNYSYDSFCECLRRTLAA
jgi:glycosyltransferase involved in cell wall biosynthesis